MVDEDFEIERPKDELRPPPEPEEKPEPKIKPTSGSLSSLPPLLPSSPPLPPPQGKSPIKIESVGGNLDMGPMFENMESMFKDLDLNIPSFSSMSISYKKETTTTKGQTEKQKKIAAALKVNQEKIDEKMKELDDKIAAMEKKKDGTPKKEKPMKKSKSTSGTSGGIGICTILVIIFLVLKLTGNIDWSWWWVFAPYWIPTGAVLSIVLVVLLFLGIIMLALAIFKK